MSHYAPHAAAAADAAVVAAASYDAAAAMLLLYAITLMPPLCYATPRRCRHHTAYIRRAMDKRREDATPILPPR